MKRVERVAAIATPPDELFAYLADLENLDEWMAGIVSAEVTSAGEYGVGTTARVVRALGSQRPRRARQAPGQLLEHLVVARGHEGLRERRGREQQPQQPGEQGLSHSPGSRWRRLRPWAPR